MQKLCHITRGLELIDSSWFDPEQSDVDVKQSSGNEIGSVYNYLPDIDPVNDDEQQYILWKEDLLTLRPGRDHAWLDWGIERCLQILQPRVPYVQVGKVGLETASKLLLTVFRKSIEC